APTQVDFGQTPLSQPLSQNVTVSNTGELDLAAPLVVVSAPFSASGCTSAVAGGSSCTLDVRFAPTGGGVFSGQAALNSGTLSGSVALTGTGWAPTEAPQVKGTPSVGYKSGIYRGVWPATLSGISVQWVRCDADGTSNCTDIPGATSTTYRTG